MGIRPLKGYPVRKSPSRNIVEALDGSYQSCHLNGELPSGKVGRMDGENGQAGRSSARRKPDLSRAMLYFSMVKRRIVHLDRVLSGGVPTNLSMDDLIALDYVYLNIRKIIEEMMLLSVSANEAGGAEISKAIREEWNAHRIMAKLSRINPAFFPESLTIGPSDEPGIEGNFLPPSGDNLTKDQAAEIYGVCGNVLHAGDKNFEREFIISRYQEAIAFLSRVKSLLAQFLIDISGHRFMVLGRLDLEEDSPPSLFSAGVSS